VYAAQMCRSVRLYGFSGWRHVGGDGDVDANATAAGAGAGAGEGAPGGAAPVSASEKSRVGPTADGAGDGVWLEGTLMTVEGAEAETPAAAAGLG